MAEELRDLERLRGIWESEPKTLWERHFQEEPPEMKSAELLRREIAWRL